MTRLFIGGANNGQRINVPDNLRYVKAIELDGKGGYFERTYEGRMLAWPDGTKILVFVTQGMSEEALLWELHEITKSRVSREKAGLSAAP